MKTAHENIVNDFDLMTIKGIVSECNTVTEALEMAQVIFKYKIKPAHIIMLGYLIGQNRATYQSLITIQNNNTVWQRQN